MTTLGSTAEPTSYSEWFGLNTTNHFAIALTLPAGGPWEITRIGGWLAGKDETCDFKFCVWTAGGALLGSSAQITAANLAFGLGNNVNYEGDLTTPIEVAGSTTVWVGWARDPADNVQFGARAGTRYQRYSASWPATMAGYSSVGGNSAIGAYIANYQSANSAPNAPTGLSPTGSAVVNSGTAPSLSGTRSDPDSGDYITAYQIVVRNDADSATVYDSGKIAVGGSPTTFARTVSLPSSHAFYKWKARTWDKEDAAGPYSSLQRFYANSVPSTPGAPTVETDTLTPVIAGSFTDSGDTLAAVQIQVDLNASPYTSKWDSGDLVESGSSWDRTYAGSALSYGVAYRCRYRVKDSHGAYSSWGSYRTFTLVQPTGPDNCSPKTTNPRLSDLTPDLTVGHLAAQFRNEEIMVRTVASDSGGTTLWSKTWEGADYANTNSKVRTYAGTALALGGVYYWKARIELTDGTITAWTSYFSIRMNAAPTSPTGMNPTGGLVLSDTTPQLRMNFADPDLDQGDSATAVDLEVANNATGAVVFSQAAAADAPGVGEDGQSYAHLAVAGPLNSFTGTTGANATDLFTKTAHGLVVDQKVQFSALTGGTGLSTLTDYWVIASGLTANDFKLSATKGGASVNFTTDVTASTLVPQELGNDVTYKWRARFTDAMAQVGAYSSYQLFKVSQPPSAAGVAPSGTIGDSTPVIDWTFTGSGGKAQYSYRVRVFDKGPTGANYADELEVYDSTEIISAATQHDLPHGPLVSGHDYRYQVDVKDTDQLTYTLT